MARKTNAKINDQQRVQASKRHRQHMQELDLMVRFTASRDRDREGTGR